MPLINRSWIALTWLLLSGSLWGAEVASLGDLQQDEPAFYVQADVDRADRYYRDGDPLRVSVVCESDAYIYVLYQQSDGKVFQIFPNSAQKNNKVAGKQQVTIPETEDTFRWQVSAPFGKEVVKVIAAKEPIEPLAQSSLQQKRFKPVSSGQLKEVAGVLQQAEHAEWTESLVEITTAARDGERPAPQGRRFGVFFGASEYEFNDLVKLATEGKWEPRLPCSANNAIAMGRLMKSVGQLDDYQVFVNEKATKANVEQAITHWLPSVSRPGDTVFIMYCGHGGQIPDDNGDERDGKDEHLLTHDYVDVGILDQLAKQATAGTLPEMLKPRFAEWVKIFQRAGSLPKANEALTRHTCISDDLFGHWLQRLSGRQVMVMLDTCHAGGFFVNEKGFPKSTSRQAVGFDFLDSEIGRLKDLGQANSSLIAACNSQESSYGLRARDTLLAEWRAASKGVGEERVVENLAVFSYYLVDGLVALPPPLTAEQMQRHCEAGMAQYFVDINEIMRKDGKNPLTPHAPVFYNHCRQPVWFKP